MFRVDTSKRCLHVRQPPPIPDDCPVDDGSRRALRDLARRADWRGQTGADGAAQDAAALRELGAEIRAALARNPEREEDHSWGRQAIERLASYCVKARADWPLDQIAELARLREDAVIALAPGPGVSDVVLPPAPGSGRTRPVARAALVVIGCLVLIALVLTLPRFFSGNSSANSPSAASSTTSPAIPTTPTSAPASTASTTTSATASPPPASASTSASSSLTNTTSAPVSTSHVTSMQITTDPLPGDPPEVILTGTINTSGTDDVIIDIAVNGTTPSDAPPIDDSGQTSYNLTQTINLSQWCGQRSVLVKVSSGSVSQSFTVPVSCSSD
jgi:hypothetical protein